MGAWNGKIKQMKRRDKQKHEKKIRKNVHGDIKCLLWIYIKAFSLWKKYILKSKSICWNEQREEWNEQWNEKKSIDWWESVCCLSYRNQYCENYLLYEMYVDCRVYNGKVYFIPSLYENHIKIAITDISKSRTSMENVKEPNVCKIISRRGKGMLQPNKNEEKQKKKKC